MTVRAGDLKLAAGGLRLRRRAHATRASTTRSDVTRDARRHVAHQGGRARAREADDGQREPALSRRARRSDARRPRADEPGARGDRADADRIRSEQQARGAYWWWYGPWYEHQNMRDERVEAFASLLWEGVHDYTYVARATTPGNFVVPPPKAEEMYMPETFGAGASDA